MGETLIQINKMFHTQLHEMHFIILKSIDDFEQ